MKKRIIHKYLIIKLICLFILYPSGLIANDNPVKNIKNGYLLMITINFDSPPTNFSISPATLKYNKDFAYSLTLDDGLSDAYQYAYFLLNGGYCNATQTNCTGLFYTDGCGNFIPFRAGISWFSVNNQGVDIHEEGSAYMSWPQLAEVYEIGWDVFNHGFSSVFNQSGINYSYEVSRNVEYVRNKTGIELSHFVVPSNDHNYFFPAFANGMKAIYGAFSEFQGFEAGIEVNSKLLSYNFRLYRRLINDEAYDTNNIMNLLNSTDLYTNNGSNPIWCNEFTHSVGDDPNGASLQFPLFSYYMEEIEKNYGRLGKDNMWMAPLQEVYEYLIIRDNVKIEWDVSNNNVIVYIDFSAIPEYLRRNALSLVVESETDFTEPIFSRQLNYNYMGTGNKKLINLEWDHGVFNDVVDYDLIENKNIIDIYPNPASKYLIVNSSTHLNSQNISLSIFSNKGDLVYDSSTIGYIDGNSFSVNIPGRLADGVYYLRLHTNGKFIGSKRFIVTNNL